MIIIDGLIWEVPCDITRVAEIRPSQISGLLLDKNWFNDVIGTYMSYTVSLAVPVTMRDLYSSLYEILTDPVDGHAVTMPYNGSTVSVTGRIQSVKDALVRFPGDVNHWKGISFTIVGNHPTKAISLSEAITRGRKALPEVSVPHEGDAWHYTGGAWVYGSGYEDADLIYY